MLYREIEFNLISVNLQKYYEYYTLHNITQ